MRYHEPNKHPSPKLTSSRSIVAAVIRLVLAFQSQVAGLGTPTDIDRKRPISPSSPWTFQQTNTTSTLRSAHIAPLLELPRSRHLPGRHQSSLHLLPLQERIPAVFRQQHTQCGFARLAAVITTVKQRHWGSVAVYKETQCIKGIACDDRC